MLVGTPVFVVVLVVLKRPGPGTKLKKVCEVAASVEAPIVETDPQGTPRTAWVKLTPLICVVVCPMKSCVPQVPEVKELTIGADEKEVVIPTAPREVMSGA